MKNVYDAFQENSFILAIPITLKEFFVVFIVIEKG